MNTRKIMRHPTILRRLFHLLLLLLSLQLSSQQITVEITDPMSQCLGQPCLYKGECRDRFGGCGDSALFCNSQSQWSPGCGGAPTLERPVQQPMNVHQTAEQPQQIVMNPSPPPPPPSNRPTMRPVATSIIDTPSPTTKWQLWTSQNRPENQQTGTAGGGTGGDDDDKPKGVPGLTTGNENGNYTSNNLTAGWFDGNKWSERPEEDEEGGIIDKIDFWNDENSAMESSRGEVIFLISIGLAWMVLL